MLQRFLVFLLAISGSFYSYAQTDSSHLRISLLTCGPGDEEIYEVFGHTGVRVIDSVKHTDLVYNYGVFSYGPDFEMQFMRGKLLYCVEAQSFYEFMQEYVEAKRSVEEQVITANWKRKEQIAYFLRWNASPENKYYKYDFFFDNCATRIRDIMTQPAVFGREHFHWGQVLPEGSKLTYRDIMNRYFYRDHWTRIGVNLLLGSRIDKVMSNTDIMFLPDYLRDGLAGATADGQKIAAPTTLLLPGNPPEPAGVDLPLLVTLLVALLTIIGLTVPRFSMLGKVMSVALLVVTGLLGCMMLFMWLGTDHQGCSDNFNLLWCLPTNLVIAFFNPKGKGKYALVAMALLFISLALHIAGIQRLTLTELSPLLLALLFVYGAIYRKRNQPTQDKPREIRQY